VNLLLQEAMVLALPHAHSLARRAGPNKALPLRALADETFIVYRRHNGPGLYDAILSACNAAGFSPRVGQEAPRIVSTLNGWGSEPTGAGNRGRAGDDQRSRLRSGS
jgi:DNA-binding transcriptional LysR family regulator